MRELGSIIFPILFVISLVAAIYWHTHPPSTPEEQDTVVTATPTPTPQVSPKSEIHVVKTDNCLVISNNKHFLVTAKSDIILVENATSVLCFQGKIENFKILENQKVLVSVTVPINKTGEIEVVMHGKITYEKLYERKINNSKLFVYLISPYS